METSSLICSANQWTGFYITGTSDIKELIQFTDLFKVNHFLPSFHFDNDIDVNALTQPITQQSYIGNKYTQFLGQSYV